MLASCTSAQWIETDRIIDGQKYIGSFLVPSTYDGSLGAYYIYRGKERQGPPFSVPDKPPGSWDQSFQHLPNLRDERDLSSKGTTDVQQHLKRKLPPGPGNDGW